MPLSSWIIVILAIVIYFAGVFVERFSYRRRILKKYEADMQRVEEVLNKSSKRTTAYKNTSKDGD